QLAGDEVELQIGGSCVYRVSFKFIYFICKFIPSKIVYIDASQLQHDHELIGQQNNIYYDSFDQVPTTIFQYMKYDSSIKYLLIPLIDIFAFIGVPINLYGLTW